MSVTYVGAGTLSRVSGGGNPTVSYPASLQDGDVILAVIAKNGPALTAPDDSWTHLAATSGLEVFCKAWDSAVGDSYVTFIGDTAIYQAQSFAYRGLNDIPTASAVASGTGTLITPPTTGPNGGLVTVAQPEDAFTATAETGATLRADVSGYQRNDGSFRTDGFVAADFLPAFTNTRGPTLSLAGSTDWSAVTVVLPGNLPPNAPAWVTAQNAAEPTDQDFLLDWDFSDPNPGDSQSAYTLNRWTLDAQGARVAGSLVTTYVETPNTWRRVTAGTLTEAGYEYQVATYDALGAEGPFSESLFVSAHPTPSGLVVTSPLGGATVPQTVDLEWSTPNEDGWQMQVLDDAGAVVQDTGTVTSTVRKNTVTFDSNNVTRTLQLRVLYQGLWSDWVTVTVTVSFTPPPAPVVALTLVAKPPSVVIGITNPAPAAEEPDTSYNDVYVTDPGSTEERRATFVPKNGRWVYETPPAGFTGLSPVTGLIRVVTVGDNGVTTDATAPGATTQVTQLTYGGGGYGAE